MTKTAKGLSLFALTMVAIGATIGSGIFETPSSIAAKVPESGTIILLWIMGGVVSLIGALVFAEMGSRFPGAGGVYTYLNAAYGKLPAFLYGWVLLTVVSSGTIASLCVLFAKYTHGFFGLSAEQEPLLAMITIAVLTLFNTFSLKSSEWFANVGTMLKMVGIFGLVILTFFLGSEHIFAAEGAAAVAPTKTGGLAGAFVGVLWSYTGWHYASFVSGDAINPKRNIPLAMLFGSSIVAIIYVSTNLGYFKTLDIPTIQASSTLAIDAINRILPGWGGYVGLLIAISVFACAGLYVLSTPRVINQMAREKLFFPLFERTHPKFGVPVNAIILQSVWAMLLVFVWGKFEALYTYVTVTEWFFLLLACIGIFLVRRKFKDQEAGFKTPLYPVLPLIFIAVIGWFVFMNATSDDKAAYYGLLVIPVGMIVYWIFRKPAANA
ncbi:MAG: amino acid permease [Flavobacteriales bacterium]|nr:amino acid permease [Flavobacteriales bacterium]